MRDRKNRKIGKIVSLAVTLVGAGLILGASGFVHASADCFFLMKNDHDWSESHLVPCSQYVANMDSPFIRVIIPRRDMQQCPAKDLVYYLRSLLTRDEGSARSLLLDFQDGTGIWFRDVLEMRGSYGVLNSDYSIYREMNSVVVTEEEMYLTDLDGVRVSAERSEIGINGFDTAMPIISAEMKNITDLRIYLDAIAELDVTVFISVAEDASFLLPEDVAKRMLGLGLKTDLRDYNGYSYAAVLDGGKVVAEELSQGPIWLKGLRQDPWMHYDVKSNGQLSGDYFREVILENRYYWFSGTRGLGFTVYDPTTDTVVDQVVFDIFEGMRCIRE